MLSILQHFKFWDVCAREKNVLCECLLVKRAENVETHESDSGKEGIQTTLCGCYSSFDPVNLP